MVVMLDGVKMMLDDGDDDGDGDDDDDDRGWMIVIDDIANENEHDMLHWQMFEVEAQRIPFPTNQSLTAGETSHATREAVASHFEEANPGTCVPPDRRKGKSCAL